MTGLSMATIDVAERHRQQHVVVSNKKTMERFTGNYKTNIPEDDALKGRSVEVKFTPEQNLAAEEKTKLLLADYQTKHHVATTVRHPDMVIKKDGTLTEDEKKRLIHARNAALEESKVRQVRPDESKSASFGYYFSW